MGRVKKLKPSPSASIAKVFIRRLLLVIGKPIFLVLFALTAITLSVFYFPVVAVKSFSKRISAFSKTKKGKKGKTKQNPSDLIVSYKSFFWKTEVLVIAVSKLFTKIKLPKKLSIPFARPSIKKLALGLIVFMVVIFSLGAFLFWQIILKDLPTPESLTQRNLRVSTKIYDRNKEILYTIYKDERRTPLTLEKIPLQAQLAVVAAEDKEFFTHPGFSVRGITRALVKDLKEGRITGGSTITQQLVKNTLLSPERTIERKLREFVLAIQVEKKYSKEKILEMYLNEIPFGGTAYGINEAARTYFDKDVSELTLSESALLAGLPQSPTKYSPFGPNPEASIARQKQVLQNMLEAGFITLEQKETAEKEKITFSEKRESIKAPHFVFYVRDILEEKYGKETVEQGGLEVVTTLDLNIQHLAEEVVNQELEKLKNLNVQNASVIVMNPKTGEILAMVGSKDYFDTKNGGNVNVTLRPRQPGSSIKVVNYAYALSNGLTAATIIPDTPSTFEVEGQPPYTPKNYEGEFRGNISLRSALAESRNIPAVKVLASYGVDKMIELGTSMGITSWDDPDNYGLSLTLGGGEVRLIDLANVFSTISNYGRKNDVSPILKVSDYQGKTLEEFECQYKEANQVKLANQDGRPDGALRNDLQKNPVGNLSGQIISDVSATNSAQAQEIVAEEKTCGEQVIDERVSFLLTDILKDNSARAPSFGTNSLLVVKDHPEVAVKTGTSNDLRDNLTVGYNQDYLVAVWIGNNDNSPMDRIASGVTGATPIFNKIMSALLANTPSREWMIPEKMIRLPICPYTGTLACTGCPVKMEWFLEETKPQTACNPEWFNKENDNGNENPAATPFPRRNMRPDFREIFQEQSENLRRNFRGD